MKEDTNHSHCRTCGREIKYGERYCGGGCEKEKHKSEPLTEFTVGHGMFDFWNGV